MHCEVEVNVARKGAEQPIWRPMIQNAEGAVAQWPDAAAIAAEAADQGWADQDCRVVEVGEDGGRRVLGSGPGHIPAGGGIR